MVCWFVSSDLMFASRVEGAAARAECGYCWLSFAAASRPEVFDHGISSPELILVDLAAADATLAAAVALWKERKPAAKIVAFGPHVHEARLAAARDAGCDVVLTRGQFERSLDEIFRSAIS